MIKKISIILLLLTSETLFAAPIKIHIIVASVRKTQTGEKIAHNIKNIADKRTDIITEIVKVSAYNLPFYTDEIAPGSREGEITDPVLKKWSDKIEEADAYIIIAPEYNAGIPGPLKNALDSLYREWNNKPVAFISYSGGSSGGSSTIDQLRHITAQGLQMIPVDGIIKIPQSWKALNDQGKLMQADIEQDLNKIIDQLITVYKKSKV